MEPFRAFVADLLPEQQRTHGFAMQSLFIGLGAVVASALPWMLTNWFHLGVGAAGHAIPLTVRLSFYTGAAVFFGAVLWTIVTTKEYPPEDMDAFRQRKAEKRSLAANVVEILDSIARMPKTMRQLAPVQILTWLGLFCMWLYFPVAVARNVFGAPRPPRPSIRPALSGVASALACTRLCVLPSHFFFPRSLHHRTQAHAHPLPHSRRDRTDIGRVHS